MYVCVYVWLKESRKLKQKIKGRMLEHENHKSLLIIFLKNAVQKKKL